MNLYALLLCILAATVSQGARPTADLFQSVLWDGAINERNAANPHMQAQVGHISVGFPPVLADMAQVLPYAQVAFSTSQNLFNTNGWYGLFVEVSEQVLPYVGEEKAYYAAGFGEGYLTAGQIYDHYRNSGIAAQRAGFSNASKTWLSTHIAHMYNQSSLGGAYNEQLKCHLALISGITDGYNNAVLNYGISLTTFQLNLPQLTFEDFFLISFSDEVADMVASTYVASGTPMPSDVFEAWQKIGEHCSALIKVVTSGANTGEIFFGHTTWGSLNHMLRMYKTYRFGSFQVQFSGFPANINSGDDFYVLNNNLTVMETTNANKNVTSLMYVTPISVSEFLRVMIMHKLSAGSAQTWATGFCDYNSGTYNNQWMVLEMGQYGNNTDNIKFWVTEQMPGMCVFGDQSAVLKSTSYWASYNRAFYPEVFAYSGFKQLADTVSTYYSYADNYRAEIFRRDHGTVVDEASMKAIMRYNDYLHDEFSLIPNCTAANPCDPVRTPYLSISNRADLIPLNAKSGVLSSEITNQDMAAYDAKIISFSKYMASFATDQFFSASIVNGPTHGGKSDIPKFRYSTSLVANLTHHGIPDEIGFDWVASDTLFAGAPVPIPFPTTQAGMDEFTYMNMDVSIGFNAAAFKSEFQHILDFAMAGGVATFSLVKWAYVRDGIKLTLSIRAGTNPDVAFNTASLYASYRATQIQMSALTGQGFTALSTIRPAGGNAFQ